MTLRYRVMSVVAVLIALGWVTLALVLRHNSPCGPAAPLPANAERMKAIVYRCYGPADVLRLEQIARPTVADDQVLVKVHAAALNPLDWHYMRGTPYFMRLSVGLGKPEDTSMGVDFAGTVEAVGKSVTRFKPGDEVFGGRGGALAEYVAVRDSRAIALKPASLTFEQAAALPIAAVTALQALRDKAQLKPGQKVLINGASGGVGTFAVQIAKFLGAEVTGVCSTKNVALVQSLGADHVIDYTREDFTQSGEKYDLILDNVGNHSLLESRRALKPEGQMIMLGGGGPTDNSYIGPMTQPIKGALLSPFVSQKFAMFLSDLKQSDLEVLSGLIEQGKIKPVIDKRYPLSEVPAAMRYLEEGHVRGKVVINVE